MSSSDHWMASTNEALPQLGKIKASFSVLQTRRFWSSSTSPPVFAAATDKKNNNNSAARVLWVSPEAVALCPSMDLLTVAAATVPDQHQQQPSASSKNNQNLTALLGLHRSLSLQKLATIFLHPPAVDADPSPPLPSGASASLTTLATGTTDLASQFPPSSAALGPTKLSLSAPVLVAWRPDGRWMAVLQPSAEADHSSAVLTLYNVETLVQQQQIHHPITTSIATPLDPSAASEGVIPWGTTTASYIEDEDEDDDHPWHLDTDDAHWQRWLAFFHHQQQLQDPSAAATTSAASASSTTSSSVPRVATAVLDNTEEEDDDAEEPAIYDTTAKHYLHELHQESSYGDALDQPLGGGGRRRKSRHYTVLLDIPDGISKPGVAIHVQWFQAGRLYAKAPSNPTEDLLQNLYFRHANRYDEAHLGAASGSPGFRSRTPRSGGAGVKGGTTAAALVWSHHPECSADATTMASSSQPPTVTMLVSAFSNYTLSIHVAGRYCLARNLTFAKPPHNRNQQLFVAHVACSNDLAYVMVAAATEEMQIIGSADIALPQETKSPTTFPLLSIWSLAGCSPFTNPSSDVKTAIPRGRGWARHRRSWQALVHLFQHVQHHWHGLPLQLSNVFEAWNSSLHPWHMKYQTLTRLLHNYGLLGPLSGEAGSGVNQNSSPHAVASLLRAYILQGHTPATANLSNAFDQFFTSVQMNDQLIQRMERSLTVALANVESLLRKVMSSVRALVLHADAIVGWAKDFASSNPIGEPENDGTVYLRARRLQLWVHRLSLSLESALGCLIDARFRFRDWIAWLRSTGAQIKARGTAPHSVQRENARKRRAHQDTVSRVLGYLHESAERQPSDEGPPPACSAAAWNMECLLCIPWSDHWNPKRSVVEAAASSVSWPSKRSSSPQSVTDQVGMAVDNDHVCRGVYTLPHAFAEVTRSAQIFFALPPRTIDHGFARYDVECSFPEDVQGCETVVSTRGMTVRLGSGRALVQDEEDDAWPGCFHPTRWTSWSTSTLEPVRQWCLVAGVTELKHSHGEGPNSDVLKLHALPLPWQFESFTGSDILEDDTDDEDCEDESLASLSYCLTASLEFPFRNYRIADAVFYGDDGKSALYAGTTADRASGSGIERRQALAVLVCFRRQDLNEPSSYGIFSGDERSICLELWLVPYDKAGWCTIPLQQRSPDTDEDTRLRGAYQLDLSGAGSDPTILQATAQDDEDDQMQEDNRSDVFLSCRRRHIGRFSSFEEAQVARLKLSGSRGIAVILSQTVANGGAQGTVLEVLDLEEDEEVEHEDENFEESVE